LPPWQGEDLAMSGHGTPLWNELSTSDVEAAKAFYARLLGWQYDIMPMPEGDYVVAKAGDAMTGGIMKLPMPEMASQWVPYFHVDDVDAAHAVAAEAGGTTLTPVTDVSNVGRMFWPPTRPGPWSPS